MTGGSSIRHRLGSTAGQRDIGHGSWSLEISEIFVAGIGDDAVMALLYCFGHADEVFRRRQKGSDRQICERSHHDSLSLHRRAVSASLLVLADRSWLRGQLQEREAGGRNWKLPLSIDSLVVLNGYFRIHA